MSDDVKALIAEARTPQHTIALVGRSPADVSPLIRRLADALESSVQAPASTQVEEFEFMRGVLDGANANNEITYSVYCELHDAVDRAEVVQAPAVDRKTLAAVIHERFNLARGRGGVAPLALANQIIASGILQDAREVEARGLEKFARALLARVGSVVRHAGGAGAVFEFSPKGTETEFWGYGNAVAYTGAVLEVLDMLGARPENLTATTYAGGRAEPRTLDEAVTELRAQQVRESTPEVPNEGDGNDA